MRRDELITKLARELPHWPAGLNKEQLDRLIAPILMPEFADDYHGSADNLGRAEAYLHVWNITRYDYLAERERLINKPGWKYAPEWANYLCQQQTGVWRWYAYEPDLEWNKWAGGAVNRSVPACNGSIPVGHDWRDTLEKRSEPVPKAWIGEGLPPVGTKCEALMEGKWEKVEILVHYTPVNSPAAVFAYDVDGAAGTGRLVSQLIAGNFRPLRSEEDKQIDAMKSAASISYVKPEYMEMICRALYRAGYRKAGGDA